MLPDALLAPGPALNRSAALRWARQTIDRLDARLLLQFVTGCSAADLLAYPETSLSAEESNAFEALVIRRQRGEPLAYLTGMAGFYGELLQVSPAVLVPRPETEDLVAWVLQLLADCTNPRIADLGTGSGAIALALAGARPDAHILAIDVSSEAVAVASANRERLSRHNVELRCASWLEGVNADPLFDLVVSNPPYIDAADPHLTGDGVRFEPRLALTDGGNGLSAYETMVVQAVPRLKAGGWLVVEHGHDQADAVKQFWREAGLVDIDSRHDLSGNPRMTAGRKPPAQKAGND